MPTNGDNISGDLMSLEGDGLGAWKGRRRRERGRKGILSSTEVYNMTMTSLGAYGAILAFPLMVRVQQEASSFPWVYKHANPGTRWPLPPPTPEEMEGIWRNHRYLLPIKSAILCTFIYSLMRRYSLPAGVLGLNLRAWPLWLGLGVGMGVARFAVTHYQARKGVSEAPYEGSDYLTRGSVWHWVLNNIVTCFAEEFWRAFGLISLLRLGHGAVFAVAVTSVAFALGHCRGAKWSGFEVGTLFAHATFGVLFAIVFLWSGSLVAPYTAHLFTNLVVLYRVRTAKRAEEGEGEAADGFALSQEPASHGSPAADLGGSTSRLDEGAEGKRARFLGMPLTVPCPACKQEIARIEMKNKEFFPCPCCGTSLETDKSLGTRVALASVLLAGAVSYFAGGPGLKFALSIVLLTVLFFFCITFVHSAFWPKLVVGVPPHPRTEVPRNLLYFRITGPRDPPKTQ
jgi:membrane protease YdiL (CAAX protease family)